MTTPSSDTPKPLRSICEGCGEYEDQCHCPMTDLRARLERAERERDRLHALVNSPELIDFQKAVVLEAAHQRERWGSDHDARKTEPDWFWLVGYVAGKALSKPEKRLHHIITTAAACANWHAAALGKTNMRPGISEEKQEAL